ERRAISNRRFGLFITLGSTRRRSAYGVTPSLRFVYSGRRTSDGFRTATAGDRMSVLWTKTGAYKSVSYGSEADLESAIVQVQRELFGPNRFYLDIKKKIGARGGIRNIPDGYLIDLNGSKPRLYVVENELAAHDPLRHIAVQILQFSLSFESEQ